MNIPNILSLSRLLTMPIIVWFIISGEVKAAFWIFFVAAISDVLDGIVAKKLNMITQLGKYLDPLADKTLLVSVYFTLGQQNFLPLWLVMLVIFRDVLIIGGAILFDTLTRALVMEPLVVSKINTFFQVLLAGGVLYLEGFKIQYDWFSEYLYYAVASSTIVSGVCYVIIWGTRAVTLEKKIQTRLERDMQSHSIENSYPALTEKKQQNKKKKDLAA